MTAHGLLSLSFLYCPATAALVSNNHPLTAGLIAQWMRREFIGLSFRDGYGQKSRKFLFPDQRHDPRLQL